MGWAALKPPAMRIPSFLLLAAAVLTSVELRSPQAFMGVPPAPKKQAISLCEWAIRATAGDPDEAGTALRVWAKKNGKGLYNSISSRPRKLLTRTMNTFGASGGFRAAPVRCP